MNRRTANSQLPRREKAATVNEGGSDVSEAARCWVAQVLGGIVAAGVLLAIAAVRKGGYDAGTEGLGANGYGEHSPADYA